MTVDVIEPAVSYPRRWAAAIVLIVAALTDLLNSTIVNVGLPTIARDLRADGTALEWFSAAYLVAFAVVLITFGRVGDRWGRKRVFLAGAAAFGVASLLCSVAQDPVQLIVARALQGLASAAIIPQVMSTLLTTFTGRQRGIVMGLFGTVAGLAQALGLTLGGALITANALHLGWRSIFLINVPLVLVLLPLGAWLVPETRVPGQPRPNLVSAGVLTAALLAILFPLMEGRRLGWPAWSWLSLVAGVLAVAGLVLVEARRRDGDFAALLPVGLFRIRTFNAGLTMQLLVFIALNGFLLVLTLWLQDGQGYSPLRAALVTLSFSAGALLAAAPAGRLTPRFGGLVSIAGCSLFALGVLGIVAAGLAAHDVPPWAVLPGLFVLGIGLVTANVSLSNVSLSAAPIHVAGTASGIWSTAQQFGGALGVAGVGAIFFGSLGGGYTAAFTGGAVVVAVCLGASAVLGLMLPRTLLPPSARP